jgi:hypothetical protein
VVKKTTDKGITEDLSAGMQCWVTISNASNMSLEIVENQSTIPQKAWIFSQQCCEKIQSQMHNCSIKLISIQEIKLRWKHCGSSLHLRASVTLIHLPKS